MEVENSEEWNRRRWVEERAGTVQTEATGMGESNMAERRRKANEGNDARHQSREIDASGSLSTLR